MTVSANDRRYECPGNGIATVFNGPKLFKSSDLLVYLVDATTQVATLQVENVDYAVTGVGLPQSTVTMTVAPPTGKTLLLLRSLAYDQQTDITNQGAFLPEVHEDTFDRIEMQIQQLSDGSSRALKFSDTFVGTFDNQLPQPQPLAPLAWDASGQKLQNGDLSAGDMLLRPDLADGATVGKGATLVAYQQSGTSAAPRTAKDFFAQFISYLDFRFPDDVDDTAAFNRGLTGHDWIFVPPSASIAVSDAILMSSPTGKFLIGAGRGSTIITSSASNKPVIQFGDFSRRLCVAGMTLQHSGTPVAGGDGIYNPTSCSQCDINDVLALSNYVGFNLGVTDYGMVRNCYALLNLSHGYLRQNTAAGSTMQWYMKDCLSQRNAGDGFADRTVAGVSQVSIGELKDCRTYANDGYGYSAQAVSSCAIQSVRIKGCFFGQDGKSEVYLDTYGYGHKISDTECELAGTTLTGVSQTTPISHIGCGIEITANNTDVQINGGKCDGNSFEGISSAATYTSICGTNLYNNGVAGVAGRDRGVTHAAGSMVVLGGFIGNRSGTYQKYGVFSYNGSFCSITGAALIGNVTGPFGATTNINLMGVLNCLPYTTAVQIPAGSGVSVGNVAPLSNGTINTAAGMYKAGVAYTNP